MSAAFAWGALAASSLLIGAALALRVRVSGRVAGLVLAFGAGVLISAVAYELVEEAFSTSHGSGWVAAGLVRRARLLHRRSVDRTIRRRRAEEHG